MNGPIEEKSADIEAEIRILEDGIKGDFWRYIVQRWAENNLRILHAHVLKHQTSAIDPIMRDRICERLGGIQAVLDYPAQRLNKLNAEKKARVHNKELTHGDH